MSDCMYCNGNEPRCGCQGDSAYDPEELDIDENEVEEEDEEFERMERNRENADIYDCDFAYDNDFDCIHDC